MLIKDGDFIVLRRESFMRVVQARKNGRPIILDKTKFHLDNIFGQTYGTQFQVDKKSQQLVPRDQSFSVEELLPEGTSGLDNRNLISANEDNQNLGKDEIQALRKDGLTDDEVMSQLIKNSSTFNQKTKFSQEKWIKKKKKRHMNIYTVLRPCTRLIADMYYQRDPSKICFLRMDSLAQLLTMSNVQSNSKVLLVESCQGLLAGAILSRLGSDGCLAQLFTGPNPMKGRNAFDDFGYTKELTRSRMKLYPLNQLDKLAMFSKDTLPVTSSSPPSEMSSSTVVAAKKVRLDGDESNVTPTQMTSSSPLSIDANSQTISTTQTVDSDAAVISTTQTVDGDAAVISTTQAVHSDAAVISAQDVGTVTATSAKNVESNTHGVKRAPPGERELPVHLVERQAAKQYIESTQFDTMVVAVKAQPTQVVLRLISLLKMSSPFVVFHQYKEPLVELFVQLKERGGVVNLKLTESWFRTIQVLPERTHPTVNMSGTSGYILTGTIVSRS